MESKEELKRVFNILKIEIKKYKLEFNNKTKIYKYSDNFNYLGINYSIRNNRIIKRINKINYINYKYYLNYFK